MKSLKFPLSPGLLGALLLASSVPVSAQIITNGGFESGFVGWTRADQLGSEGTFFLQTGTVSPVLGFTVPSPPQGNQAAMTDAGGGGSHILYQNFVVPVSVSAASISFALFLNSGDAFFTKSDLDWADTMTPGTLNLNQQVRIDLLRGNVADPFSTSVGDILQNLYQTNPGDSLTSGYTTIQRDVTTVFQANAGQMLRLRFAEVDNVSYLNAGVDNVSVTVTAAAPAAPEPSSLLLAGSAVLALSGFARHRRRRN